MYAVIVFASEYCLLLSCCWQQYSIGRFLENHTRSWEGLMAYSVCSIWAVGAGICLWKGAQKRPLCNGIILCFSIISLIFQLAQSGRSGLYFTARSSTPIHFLNRLGLGHWNKATSNINEILGPGQNQIWPGP
jgi:hypothetical protein